MATLAEAQSKYDMWRKWQSRWSWANILLGGTSVALGAVVAANTSQSFLPEHWVVVIAVGAPVLTFILTTLKPQAQAAAFNTASRELEKALIASRGDDNPTNGNGTPLADAMTRGVDMLNRIGNG